MKKIIRLICFTICCLATVSYAQNAPQSIAGTVVSLNSTDAIPLYTTGFNNISSCNLKLTYDPAIANITSVTIGPEMGGMISTNLSTPGVVIIGWFTSEGINLPDNSVMFYLNVSKTGNGYSPVQWVNDGYSCMFSDGSFAILNDEPTSNYYIDGSLAFQSPDAPVTSVPDIAVTPGSSISVPVSVSNFQMIGSLSLSLHFNPAVMSFQSFLNNSGFPGLNVNGSQPGIIQVNGLVDLGNASVSLADNATLLTLNFNYLDGFTTLEWFDNGSSCQYTGSVPVYPVLNDLPQNNYYINGSVSANALPGSAGSISGPNAVCIGSTGIAYSVPVIAYATGYVWEVPDGSTIAGGQNTNSILLDFGPVAFTGAVSVYGINQFGNGLPSILEVSSVDQPGAAASILGPQEVCQGQGGFIYSVDPIENATTYNWYLPVGGEITGGFNTNSISVTYSNIAVSGPFMVNGSNVCGPGLVSEPYPVFVNELPVLISQPVSPPAVYAGSGIASFAFEAVGAGLTFQWQEFHNGWNDLYENEMYSGVNADTLIISAPGISMNDFRYRCVITGICEPVVVTDGNATLTVLMPVGIEERNNEYGLHVYPNPCSGELKLDVNIPQMGKFKVSFTNLTGVSVEMINKDLQNQGNQSLVLDTSGLKPGLYTLSLNFESANNLMMRKQKIVILH